MARAKRRKPDPDLDQRPASGPEKAKLELARERFKAIQDTEKEQRERERADLRFYAGDQWPDDVVTSRAGQNASNGLPPVPARPCLVINKAREPVRQVLNQERQSDLGIEIVPADDFGSLGEPINDDEIDLREGFVRRIQRASDATAARSWAFERSTIAGRGYYGVMTKYGEGKTFDQEVYVRRFYDQSGVYLGPHEQPDGSDAEYGFVGTHMAWDKYIEKYKKLANGKHNPFINAPDADQDFADFAGLGDDYKLWFSGKGESRQVVLVEYWYTDYKARDLAQLPDGSAVWADELPEGVVATDTRAVVEQSIKFCIIDGVNESPLEETDWQGHYLPIIKVLGEELQPYDDQCRFEGMIRPGRDAAMGFNFMVSKLVETVGLTPIPPLILDPESIEGWEAWYQSANTRTLPYLPQRSRGDDGREFREAHRPNVDPNLQPMALSIGMFDQFIQSTVGVHDPSNGKVDPRLKSGKAIEAVVAQDAHGTSNFIDNLARSIHYEGMIINDLLYPIYGTRPGRIAKIINGDGEPQAVMLNQPFTAQNGSPQPVMMPPQQPGMPSQPMPAGHPMMPPEAKHLTLSKDAKFSISVKVTKNYDLKREQTAAFLGELISANPQAMTQYGDLFFKSIDVPDHQEMAERAKIMLDPRIQQAIEAKKQGVDIPPSVQAHISQMQQQMQHLTQISTEQQRIIDKDQVKSQTELQKAQLDAQTRLQLKQMEITADAEESAKERELKLAVAEIASQSKDAALFMDERARIGDQQHEVAMATGDAVHAHLLAEQQASSDAQAQAGQQAHEAGQQQADVVGQATLADQGHGQALVQNAQQAALAPPPTEGAPA